MKKKLLTTPIIAIIIFVLLGGSIGFATIYLGGSGRTDEINLQKGLVGHWTLDGNAKDSTPYNNHGIIYEASSTADRKGQSGKALSFDGTNDYVEVPDSASLFKDGFESGDLSKWRSSPNTDGGDLSVTTTAALHGSYGLSCLIDDTTYLRVYDDTPNSETRYRVRFYIDPNSITMADGTNITLISLWDSGWTASPFIVRFQKNSGVYQIIVNDNTETVWWVATISDAPHYVEVDWKAGVADAFLKFWLDGSLVGSNTALAGNFIVDFVYLGATSISSGISGTFYLDDFASNNDGTLIGPVGSASLDITDAITVEGWAKKNSQTILFKDGFETGDLSKWRSNPVTDGGDLSVTTTAALHGSYGLSCLIDDTTYLRVYDDTPNSETRYRVRFYIDPNSITMADGTKLILLALWDSEWTACPFYIYLWKNSGVYQIIVSDHSGVTWFVATISDAPHYVEVDWKAGVANAFLKFWLDGSLVGSNTALASNFIVDFVYIGASEISSGISGTFFLDDFASNNTGTPIGPVGYLASKGENAYALKLDEDGSNLRGDINNTEISASVSNPTEWHHYALTYDGSNQKLYIDGILATTTSKTGSINANSTNLRIGEYFNGFIDEVHIYNRALSAGEIKALYESYDPAPRVSDLQKGLIGHWILDGNAKDSTPYGNNGTIYEASSTADRKGKANGALSFDGSNDYVNVGANISLGTGPFTFSAWYKGTEAGDWKGIVGGTNGGSTGFAINIHGGKIQSWVNNNADSGSIVVNNNVWHHAVITRNGTTGQIFVDGVQDGGNFTTDGGNVNVGQNWWIGGWGSTSYLAKGLIDEVRIWNRALSADEIKALYESYDPAPRISDLQKGLVGYWTLDGHAKDSTPYSNHGTIYEASSTADRKGQAGKALSFDGSNDYVSLPNDIVLVSTIRLNGVSYSAWIKTNNNTIEQRIVGQQISSGYSDYSSGGLGIDTSGFAKMRAYSDSDPAGYVGTTGTTQLQTDTWYHILGTYDPTDKKIRIYVNGVLEGTPASIGVFSRLFVNEVNRIGKKEHVTPYYTNGLIDEVRIYNRALSEAEIKALYESYK